MIILSLTWSPSRWVSPGTWSLSARARKELCLNDHTVSDLVSLPLGESPDLEPLRQGQKGVEAVLLHVHLTVVHEVEDHLQVLPGDTRYTYRRKNLEK